MKRIFIFTIILLPAFCYGQDSTITKSKFEAFSSETGRMLKTETFEAGSEKDYKLSITKVTDLETKASVKAVQIYQTKNLFLIGLLTTFQLYVDWEEVPGFITALKYQNSVMDSKPINNVSYTYSTTNGVVSTCTYLTSGDLSGWNFVFSKVYQYSRATVTGSQITIKRKDLIKIIDLLEQSLKKDY